MSQEKMGVPMPEETIKKDIADGIDEHIINKEERIEDERIKKMQRENRALELARCKEAGYKSIEMNLFGVHTEVIGGKGMTEQEISDFIDEVKKTPWLSSMLENHSSKTSTVEDITIDDHYDGEIKFKDGSVDLNMTVDSDGQSAHWYGEQSIDKKGYRVCVGYQKELERIIPFATITISDQEVWPRTEKSGIFNFIEKN